MPHDRTNLGKPIGHPTGQNTPVSNCFCQENLTKPPKKVFNRDTYLISSYMGLNKIGTGLAALTLSLSSTACAQENSDNSPQIAERDAVVQVTREQCLAIADRDGKIACLTQLRTQREAETAALEQQLADQQREIAALDEAERTQNVEIAALDGGIATNDETIASQEAEGRQLDTTINGLRRVAALQEGRDVPQQ